MKARTQAMAPGTIPVRTAGIILVFVLALSGCSLRRYAINQIGNSLANSGTTFAADDDPELVGGALPFSLKLMESVLAENPGHRGLLLATSSGFTQFTYVYVQQPADQLEGLDLKQCLALRARARRLYLRARDYGLRGLELRHPGFTKAIHESPRAAVERMGVADVPWLYWTAVAWGAAISVSKDDPELIADQTTVEALIDRAATLDPNYDHGAIDSFLITYESARQGAAGDFSTRSRRHFHRAVDLTEGKLAAPYLAMAETVSIAKQDRQQFESLLQQALQVDVNARPEWRLSNIVMQRRARWLLGRADELFVESASAGPARAPGYAISVQSQF